MTLCKCKTKTDDSLEEPLLQFCENDETNSILDSMHNSMYAHHLPTIHEYGEEHV